LIASHLTNQANENTLAQAADLERSRWGREDERRHEDARWEAYHVFLATADEAVHGLIRLLDRGDLDADFAGANWEERMRSARDLIEFVGTPETIELARIFDRAVHRLITGISGIKHAHGHDHEQEHAAEMVDDADEDVAIDEEIVDEDVVEDLAAEGEVEDAYFDQMGDSSSDVPDEGFYVPGSGRTGLGGLHEFMETLPYPVGDEGTAHRMYGGDPWTQIVMARTELRVRRHEFVNAARRDLGMPEVGYPDETPQFVGPVGPSDHETGLDAEDPKEATGA
jgi:hypothetical protein